MPQYHRYHAEVSYLDELPLIWGKKWGAQGIGRLREVAMVKPDHDRGAQALRAGQRVLRLRRQHAGPRTHAGAAPAARPALRVARNQGPLHHLAGRSAALGLRPDEAQHLRRCRVRRQRRRDHSARGDTLLARPLALRHPVPHGHRLPDPLHGARLRRVRDRCIGAHERRLHRADAVHRLQPRGRRAGDADPASRRLQGGSARISPGPLYSYHDEVPGWMHADMWIMPLDARLA